MKKNAEAVKIFIHEHLQKNTSMILVAEKNRDIVGYIPDEVKKRLPFQKLQKIGCIYDLVVSVSERNKSVGSLLLQNPIFFFK